MIPYSKQNINSNEIKKIIEVLESDYLTQGPVTPQFESKLQERFDSKYAAAFVNATSALHAACVALELKEGDYLWTSPITFVASANCAKYCGADVDLVDIDKESYNISIPKLEEKLAKAEKENKLPKIVVPVHLAGLPCDMESIHNLSLKYGFKIIEDASHAVGSMYFKNKVGSCKHSDITVFSFHPVKIITTCEGGVCLTNNKDLYKKLFNFRSHGIIKNENAYINKNEGLWYYEMQTLGYNLRLNDLQSALGITQLERLDEFIKKRNELADYYDHKLKDIDFVKTPYKNENYFSSYHLYIILVDPNGEYGRKKIFERLRSHGYYVNVHYIPIYKHPYYNYIKNNFPNSEEYYQRAISIPLFPDLELQEANKVVSIIKNDIGYQTIF